MSFLEAVILGIVEGLTEFLPISSTGHLILTSHFLKIGENASNSGKAFEIIIQSGAILAVIYEYRSLFFKRTVEFFNRDKKGVEFYLKLFCAFLPAAVVGLLFHSFIKEKLFGVLPVVAALFVGGIAMIIVERVSKKNKQKHSTLSSHENMPSWKQTWGIGVFQILSLWPGTSRSMATILGGRLMGLSASASAEFSFFLAVPTLLAATFYDFFKNYQSIISEENFLMNLVTGTTVSFVVALIVIRWFIKFLKNRSLEPFAWYRIALSLLILFLYN